MDISLFKEVMKSVKFLISMKYPMFNCKINELSIGSLPNPKFLNIIQGGDHLDLVICPFEGFLERRGVPPNLMGPPKILYLSVSSEAVPIYLNTAYKLVHQNLFQLYTDLCKNL